MADDEEFPEGARVELIRVDDPHTELRPGDQGIVRELHPATEALGGRRLDVDWETGSTLTLLLDEGDAARVVQD